MTRGDASVGPVASGPGEATLAPPAAAATHDRLMRAPGRRRRRARGNSQPGFVYRDDMTDNDKQTVERERTDESLRVERVRTDEHLTAGRKALADEVSEARDKADDVL